MEAKPTYLKERTGITSAYVEKLKAHILTNQDTFFAKENEADSWQDFVRFPTMQTDRNHLCLPAEPFLVDRSVRDGEHWYCICTITERGRVGMEIPVVAISDLDQGKWRNGYFLLPVLT